MTTTAIKKQIHSAIDIIESEQLLKAIYMILNQEIKNKTDIIKPYTLDEFYERNAQSQKEILQRKLIDHKSVNSKFASK